MMMFNKVVKQFQWGNHPVRLETGEIARQAGGAALVDVDETLALATVVGAKSARPSQDFFPLTVDYIEKSYAAGRIPGGFFRREGRPSEGETLISRLIDRPLRPLFPEGLRNEVQIVVHVLSLNPEVPADIPALIGASAALALSGIPFNGPIGAARVAYINGCKQPFRRFMHWSAKRADRNGTGGPNRAMKRFLNVSAHSLTKIFAPLTSGAKKPRAANNCARCARRSRHSSPRKRKPRAALRRSTQPSMRCYSSWKRRLSARKSYLESRASMGAARARSVRSPSAAAFCRARTAARCLHAAKRRRWRLPRSARRAMNR